MISSGCVLLVFTVVILADRCLGDENEHKPEVFIALGKGCEEGHRTIEKWYRPGLRVCSFNVVDFDAGANGQIDCSVWPNHFTVEQDEGIPAYYGDYGDYTVEVVVDTDMFNFGGRTFDAILTCTDRGSPSKSMTHKFKIEVEA